jgi:DNA topoisomerase-1
MTETVACDAFPNGIPDEIAYEDNLHTSPYPGDHGIQFAAAEQFESPEESKGLKFNPNHDSLGRFTTGGGETLYAAVRDEGGVWRGQNNTPLPSHVQKLGIPPAWTEVFANKDPDGDMMARGRDAKGRLQVMYSQSHAMKAAADKFGRVTELRKKRAAILNEVDQDAKGPQKENAHCLRLVMTTGIRPGSDKNTLAEKKAYGATTLEGRHVVVKGGEVRLRFVGKKGVNIDIPITDKKTAMMVARRAVQAGAKGRLFNTDAASLRNYSKSKDGGGFKTKDHRTALGTEIALKLVNKGTGPTHLREYKRMVREVAVKVSESLGNTPSMALKAYIDPNVFVNWRHKVGV